MENLIGQSLGRYHILEQLGEGGMATVFKAFDKRLERQVAIKVIRHLAFTQEMVGQVLMRFEREAKALAQLSHPNIVKVYDYGEHAGSPYLVMEYIPGGTLKQRTGKVMPWREAARLLLPVARALSYAHQAKVIHRDIKPGNILITLSGEPMLSDFGIAKILENASGMTLTGTGVGIGTPEYMAPEQGMGKMIDGRSDVYALGVVMYELVTGRRPYEADTPLAVLLKHIQDPLPRPKLFVPDLPDEVEWVLLKALAKEPDERFADMPAFAEALEKLTGASPIVPPTDNLTTRIPAKAPPKPAAPLPKVGVAPKPGPKARGWWVAGLAGAGVVCIGLMAVFAYIKLNVLDPAQTRAAHLTAEAFASPSPPATSQVVSSPTPEGKTLPSQTPAPATPQAATDIPILPTDTLAILPTEAAGPLNNPADGAAVIYIPAGSFDMGITPQQAEILAGLCPACDVESFTDAQPVHTVQLNVFWIYRTEVSNAMYRLCVTSGNCQPPRKNESETRTDYYGNPVYDNYPVVYVNWYAADQYCRWAGGRLPTEAEWEYAARGNTGWLYPWGDQPPDVSQANIDNLIGDTTPVDSFPQSASPLGLLNVTGNVWEWVQDWYQKDYYLSLPKWINPLGPAQAVPPVRKAGRGGSAWISPGMSSVAMRDWYEPEKDGSAVGMRCVLPNQP